MDPAAYTDSLIDMLRSGANPEDAVKMKAYMKGRFEFLGVKSTPRKEALRSLFRKEGLPSDDAFESVVRAWWACEYREVQYCAMELFHRKKWWKRKEASSLIEFLITTKSWWDTVDFIASNICGSYFKLHYDEGILNRWNASTDFWLVRSSLLFQLKYKNTTDLDLLERYIVPHLSSKEFFVQKAIGWALREVSKWNPEYTRTIIERYPLKPVSLREAKKYV